MRSRFVVIAGVVVLAVVGSGAMPTSVMASTTVIDFDSSPNGAVVNTIAGATFVGSPSVFTPQHVATSSPSHALHTADACSNDNCPSGANQLRVTVDHNVSSVSVKVGLDDEAAPEIPVYAELYAYDSGNHLVATSGQQLVGAQGYVPITHTLAAVSAATNIRAVVISVGQTDAYSIPRRRVNIDDFTYTDDAAPPPPAAPSVTIGAPPNGSVFQRESDVHVSGSVSAPAGVNRFCLSTSAATTIPATCDQAASLDASGRFANLTVQGLHAGDNQVVAWVEDRLLRAAASSPLRVTITSIDLRPTGIELTQGIQAQLPVVTPSGDDGPHSAAYNGVRLAEGHATIVRVWVGGRLAGFGGTLSGVRVIVSGTRDGQPLGSVIAPLEGTRDLAPSDLVAAPVSRIAWSSSMAAFDFRLPQSWVSGTVSLAATVNPTGYAAPITECAGCDANNTLTLTGASFAPVATEIINPVEMIQRGPGGAIMHPAIRFDALQAMMPFHTRITPYIGQVDISDGINVSDRAMQQALALGKLIDLLDHGACWVENGRCVDGHVIGISQGQDLGSTSQPLFLCCANRIGLFRIAQADSVRPVTSIAHEFGHEVGLPHAGKFPHDCGGDQNGQRGSDWPPDQRGLLEGVGVDPRPTPAGAPPVHGLGLVDSAGREADNFDFMSYCPVDGFSEDNHWISVPNWTRLIENHLASTSRGYGPAGATPQASTIDARTLGKARPGLHVIAIVGHGATRILGVEPVVAPRIGQARRSSIHFVLRSPSHKALDIPVQPADGHMDGIGPFQLVSAVVPAAGVEGIGLKVDGHTVATRMQPRHRPRVRIIAPRRKLHLEAGGSTVVRWRVNDPDHVRVVVSVDYSADNGRHWRALVDGVRGSRYELANAAMSPSKHARLRVRASDGWHQVAALSATLRVG